MSDFMQLQTSLGGWYVVDGNCGSTAIPDDVPSFVAPFPLPDLLNEGDDGFADLAAALLPYYEGSRLFEIEFTRGWCARYSAPGYLDCTDWCGPYATEEQAVKMCRAVYGDDED